MHALKLFSLCAGSTAAGVILLSLFLSFLLPKFLSRFCTHAPGLDLVVSLFTWIPWVICGLLACWWGVLGALAGEIIGLFVWIWIHETRNAAALNGPRIVKFINRSIGRWRNHVALWVTVIALPGFLFIRFLELFVYPMLVWLLKFPWYPLGEWVNCSRQKFDGLIGHDLIWCLYCDWMTGVYSLGAEMLRNVESYWCPIRFYDGKKCENCRTDFPDIDNGWVKADGNMSDVEKVMTEKYGQGNSSWFGHPSRVQMTVKGEPIAPPDVKKDEPSASSMSPQLSSDDQTPKG